MALQAAALVPGNTNMAATLQGRKLELQANVDSSLRYSRFKRWKYRRFQHGFI
jgi:hypothetical protein